MMKKLLEKNAARMHALYAGVDQTERYEKLAEAFREDDVGESMPTETALANAPARVGDEFLLPKIVEGAES